MTYSSRRRHRPMARSMKRYISLSHDDCMLQLVDCRESSTLINHLLKGIPNSVIDWIQVRAVWGQMWGSMNITFARPRYVSEFLSVCDGAPSCCRQPCKMPALLLQHVTVTFNGDNKYVVPCSFLKYVLLQKSSCFQALPLRHLTFHKVV